MIHGFVYVFKFLKIRGLVIRDGDGPGPKKKYQISFPRFFRKMNGFQESSFVEFEIKDFVRN